ncbi:protein kinase domain-containing protein [Mucilaginibacter sp.]|jgi:serine/threonine protein kinase|uniref:protein kinase domain-containing protein n=1 Tax=Mucilaginibacter sp. TaxID=1882438 RepID=UPI002B875554|nr:protein kinase [Mucilaginibacter sp.]HTI60389.1 protein kinase [Mucilaginibacter sp.]
MSYKFVKPRGRGGFGIVNVVTDNAGTEWAQKIFNFDKTHPLYSNALRRFKREAKYQESIANKNIVPVISRDLDTDPPSFVMPLAEASLEEDMKNGIVNASNFLDVIFDIMSGLEAIHILGIFHRDLKPSNVLRFKDPSGGRDYYALSDFGMMSVKETSVTTITETQMRKLSDSYTAPEVANSLKAASVQSDIYSLGCIIHDFVGGNNRQMGHEINEGGAYGGIMLSCTRGDVSKRFKSIASMRDSFSDVDHVAYTTSTPIGQKLSELLAQNDPLLLTEETVGEIADFLERKTPDSVAVFHMMNIPLIEKMITFPYQARRIALMYATYVNHASFDFAYCDIAANRLKTFMDNLEIDVKVQGLLALLKMGTRHNRWFVEGIFQRALDHRADQELVQRMCIEFRINEDEFCHYIKHLIHSLSTSVSSFNPKLAALIQSKCY